MEIKPVARFHCPVGGKFGLPRQSGIVDSLKGHIVFEPKYRNPDAIRGLEGFSHIWLIWGFSCNGASEALTVRPPRLGGNERVGVFASRSPFRPNPLGISSGVVKSVSAVRTSRTAHRFMTSSPMCATAIPTPMRSAALWTATDGRSSRLNSAPPK